MPLVLPDLDDRSFEQLVEEAKRRIVVHTPEWNNFGVGSDPGFTIIELFAYMAENVLYRLNRVPERNRLKFLQLLGIPLQQAATARGLVAIRNERGPLEPLPLAPGVVVAAGNVSFLTRDGVNVLPVEAQFYYKQQIPEDDRRYAGYALRYEAVRAAALAETGAEPAAADVAGADAGPALEFYETVRMTMPSPGDPRPVTDLAATMDRALYLALLAPPNVSPDEARRAVANQVLSIGIVPALEDMVPPLTPMRPDATRAGASALIYEIADAREDPPVARYAPLTMVQQPDVFRDVGIVQVVLPEFNHLKRWEFREPLQEGTGRFPPRLEDEEVARRLVTWIRVRLRDAGQNGADGAAAGGEPRRPTAVSQSRQTTPPARLTWAGINAVRVTQAVTVINELVGEGTGEPDQSVALANTPVIESSILLEVEDGFGNWEFWRLIDDLLAAGADEKVFTLDPEAGVIRFGALQGVRPQRGQRIRASYEYGGGVQGNVGIDAIRTSPDPRLQGGYKIGNPIPTWGGDVGESVEDGEQRIPSVLRHRDRLVTAQDFEDVTRRTPGVDVGRVEAIPLFHPETQREDAPGVVTVMVVPVFDAARPFWPSPDRHFLRTVCDYLEPRRLVTTEIYVRGPEYVSISVSVGVRVSGGHFRDTVLQSVTQRLNLYLSSLPPGGSERQGWALKKRLLARDLEAVVTRVAGVEFVEGLLMGVGTADERAEYELRDLQLPRLAAVRAVEGAPEPLSSLIDGAPPPEPATRQVVPVPVSRARC